MQVPAKLAEKLMAVPLFPLPNVVLFPRAVLPLHIFEERYKHMTADSVKGDRLIAMALLKSGWEKDYYQRPAIEPIVCVGTILSHEKLPDGKYNFLLQGQFRASVVREYSELPYRVAELAPLAETRVMEIDLTNERHRMVSIFSRDGLAESAIGRQFTKILSSPIPTADVADLVAFNLLEDVALKQSLLGEADVRVRVGKIISALENVRVLLEARLQKATDAGMN